MRKDDVYDDDVEERNEGRRWRVRDDDDVFVVL